MDHNEIKRPIWEVALPEIGKTDIETTRVSIFGAEQAHSKYCLASQDWMSTWLDPNGAPCFWGFFRPKIKGPTRVPFVGGDFHVKSYFHTDPWENDPIWRMLMFFFQPSAFCERRVASLRIGQSHFLTWLWGFKRCVYRQSQQPDAKNLLPWGLLRSLQVWFNWFWPCFDSLNTAIFQKTYGEANLTS